MGTVCMKSQVICCDDSVDSRIFGECKNKNQVLRLRQLVHLNISIENNRHNVFDKLIAKLEPLQEYLDDTRTQLTDQQREFSYLLLNPLHKACYHHSLEFIRKLLDKGVDPFRLDEKGRNPMEVLLRLWDRQYSILGNKLRENNTLSRQDLQVLFEREYQAIKQNSLECLKLLIKQYGNVTPNFHEEQHNPLHISLELNIPEVVQYLISQGIDIETRSLDGNTPLILAAKYFNIWSIEALLEHGANVNAKNNAGLTALHYSCMSINRSKLAIDLLVKYGADVNLQSNTGFTALHYSAMSREYSKFHKLLNYDADPDLTTANGRTVLYFLMDNHIGTNAAAAIAYNHALCEMKHIRIKDDHDNLPFNVRTDEYFGLDWRFDDFTNKPRPLKQLALIEIKRRLGKKRQTAWHLRKLDIPLMIKQLILNYEEHSDVLYELGIRIEPTEHQVEADQRNSRRHARYGLWLVRMNLT